MKKKKKNVVELESKLSDLEDRSIINLLEVYADNCSTVEINFESQGVIQHFPRLPYCNFDSDTRKESFLYNVNRDTTKNKCSELHQESFVILNSLKIDYKLRSTPFIGVVFKYKELWQNYLLFMACLVNLTVILSYTTDDVNSDGQANDYLKNPHLFIDFSFLDVTPKETHDILIAEGVFIFLNCLLVWMITIVH
jgi:hypothetical protein